MQVLVFNTLLIRERGEMEDDVIGCIFGIIFLIAMLIGGSFLLSYQDDSTIRLLSSNALVNLQDDMQVEGRMGGGLFLRSGYISEKLAYSGYIDTGTGVMLKSLNADQVEIIFDEGKPRVEAYGKVSTWHKRWLLGIEIGESNYWYVSQSESVWTYKIYVPAGTVIGGYTLDAK